MTPRRAREARVLPAENKTCLIWPGARPDAMTDREGGDEPPSMAGRGDGRRERAGDVGVGGGESLFGRVDGSPGGRPRGDLGHGQHARGVEFGDGSASREDRQIQERLPICFVEDLRVARDVVYV